MNNTLKKGIVGILIVAGGSAGAVDQFTPVTDIVCDMQAAPLTSIKEAITDTKVRDGFLDFRDISKEEKASVKGCEIAKIKNTPPEQSFFSNQEYKIEIIDMVPLDGGVTVFAKAWTPQGQQLGFGPDGSVEIERFVVLNPPILVDDPQGNIIETWEDSATHKQNTRTMREDPKEAIKQALVRTIASKQQVSTANKITPGKVGNTTYTFYSDAGGDSGGSIPNQATWAAARNSTTGGGDPSLSTRFMGAAEREDAGSTFNVARGFFPFNTASLPDGDTISSATFTLIKFSGANPQTAGLVLTTQASSTSYASADFDNITLNTPAEGTSARVDTNVTNETAITFTMNATGIGWISKTGWTNLGTRFTGDIDNVTPPNSTRRYTDSYYANNTGTTKDPSLVAEVASAAADTVPGSNDVIWMN